MKRRRFVAIALNLTGSILLVNEELFANSIDQRLLNLKELVNKDLKLISLLNIDVISSLNPSQQIKLNKYFAKETISSDLIPYSPEIVIDKVFVNKLIEAKVSQIIKDKQELNSYANLRANTTSVVAGAIALGGVFIGAPILVTAFGLIGLGSETAALSRQYVDRKLGSELYRQSLESEIYGRIYRNNLEAIQVLPGPLGKNFILNKQDAFERLKKKTSIIPNVEDAINVHELAVESKNIIAQDNAKKNILDSVFDRIGEEIDLLSLETNTLNPVELAQREILYQNLFRFGSVLINEFAGETEGKLLNSALNASMSYMTMVAMGGTVTGIGWAALGVSIATDLLGAFSGKKKDGMESAFKAIFKQLRQIQESLQNIEKRQIFIMSRLENIYEAIKATDYKVDQIQQDLYQLKEEIRYNRDQDTKAQMELLINEYLIKPMQNILRKAYDVYYLKGSKRNYYLRNTNLIDSEFANIYNFITEIVKHRDFNGTGTDSSYHTNMNLYTVNHVEIIKTKIFNSVNAGSSTLTGFAPAMLYNQVGLLPFLSSNASGVPLEDHYTLPNSQYIYDGVSNLIEGLLLLPQKQLISDGSKKLWLDNIERYIEKSRLCFNHTSNLSIVKRIGNNYMQSAYKLFFENIVDNPLGLLQNAFKVKTNETFLNVNNFEPSQRSAVSFLSGLVSLQTSSTNIKGFANEYTLSAFPYADNLTWDTIPIVRTKKIRDFYHRGYYGFPSLLDKKFIRDCPEDVSKGEKVYDNSVKIDLIEILDLLKIATVSTIETYLLPKDQRVTHHRKYYSLNTKIGQPYFAKLRQITFRNDLPIIGGLNLYYAEARVISGLTPEYINLNPSDTSLGFLVALDVVQLHDEYIFSPKFPLFQKHLAKTWKQQLKDQIKQNSKLEAFSDLEHLNIIGLFEYLINNEIDSKFKPYILNKICIPLDAKPIENQSQFINKSNFDFYGCSFFLSSRMNQTIFSKGLIPFNAIHTGFIYKSNDLSKYIRNIEYLKKNNKETIRLFERLREIEKSEDLIYQNLDYDLNGSIFYYKNGIEENVRKLNFDDLYDFIIIMGRLIIKDTYKETLINCNELDDNKHCEPYLSKSLFLLSGYNSLT